MKKFLLSLILILVLSVPAFADYHHLNVPINQEATITGAGYDYNNQKITFRSETHFKNPIFSKQLKTAITDFYMVMEVYPDNKLELFADFFYYQKHVGKIDDISFQYKNYYNDCLKEYNDLVKIKR